MNVDRRPASLGRGMSAFAGSVALVTSGFYSWPALALGTAGALVLWAGLLRGTRSMVTIGAFGLFVASVIAGAQAAPIVPVLTSVVLAVVAWDAGSNAISIGEQLGRSADTTRIEVVHGAATLATGTLTAGLGYAIYRFATGGQPVAAVAFLLLGTVLLVATLD